MKARTRRDPICGKQLPPDATGPSTLYLGETWFFCSRLCQTVFEAFPEESVEIARHEADRRAEGGTGRDADSQRNQDPRPQRKS